MWQYIGAIATGCLGLYFVCGVIVVLGGFWVCNHSPFGYEDERGFHYGLPPTE